MRIAIPVATLLCFTMCVTMVVSSGNGGGGGKKPEKKGPISAILDKFSGKGRTKDPPVTTTKNPPAGIPKKEGKAVKLAKETKTEIAEQSAVEPKQLTPPPLTVNAPSLSPPRKDSSPSVSPRERKNEAETPEVDPNLTPAALGPGFTSLVIRIEHPEHPEWQIYKQEQEEHGKKFSAFAVNAPNVHAWIYVCPIERRERTDIPYHMPKCRVRSAFFAKGFDNPGLLKHYGFVSMNNHMIDVVESLDTYPLQQTLENAMQTEFQGGMPTHLAYQCIKDLLGAYFALAQRNSGWLNVPDSKGIAVLSQDGFDSELHCKFTDYSSWKEFDAVAGGRHYNRQSFAGTIYFILTSKKVNWISLDEIREVSELDTSGLFTGIIKLLKTDRGNSLFTQPTHIGILEKVMEELKKPILPSAPVKSAKKV